MGRVGSFVIDDATGDLLAGESRICCALFFFATSDIIEIAWLILCVFGRKLRNEITHLLSKSKGLLFFTNSTDHDLMTLPLIGTVRGASLGVV